MNDDPTILVDKRLVPDPSMSDAEYFHQRGAKSGPNVGKVSADMNLVTLLGGFARMSDRTEAQEAAAARFKSIVERAQIGGPRAVGYGVRVDTSPQDNLIEVGADARRDYTAVVRYLGLQRSSLLERVVVYDVPLRKIAPGSRARKRAAQAVRDALDGLAKYFRLSG